MNTFENIISIIDGKLPIASPLGYAQIYPYNDNIMPVIIKNNIKSPINYEAPEGSYHILKSVYIEKSDIEPAIDDDEILEYNFTFSYTFFGNTKKDWQGFALQVSGALNIKNDNDINQYLKSEYNEIVPKEITASPADIFTNQYNKIPVYPDNFNIFEIEYILTIWISRRCINIIC